eukprot:3427555-Prymnesium_polylepis.1
MEAETRPAKKGYVGYGGITCRTDAVKGSPWAVGSAALHIAVLRVYPLDSLRTLFTPQPIT